MLALLLFISLILSYLFNATRNLNWLTWQVFVYPIIAWIIVLPIVLAYMHFKWKSKDNSQLATSNWMSDKDFSKVTNKYVADKTNSWSIGWIAKTKLIKGGNVEFNTVKELGHAIVIGSTGSGKTSMLLNAQVQLMARNTDKPSMIFSDPKGELYETHSRFLNDQGYEVLSINLRDISKSSTWNPLEKLWDLWHDKQKPEESKEKALDTLSELASTLFVPKKGGNEFWDEGSNTIFRFFVIALLEMSEKDSSIKKEHLNLTNIVANIQQTTFGELKEFLEKLPKNSHAIRVAGRNIRGAENTVNGLFQTCVTTLQIYDNSLIKKITSETNLKIDLSRPQAIFIIVPDESKAKYPFISLFVSETYKGLIAKASVSPGNKLSRRFYFLLDEFGNIPKIPQMDAMITVARSRNIFFMLMLQNYSQLIENYGANVANTIISNCAYEYFLLTSDVETAKKFSQKLGEKSITQASRSTSSNSKNSNSSISESERTRRLIHPDELMRLKFGEFVLSMQREKPIKSSLARFWEWNGFRVGAYESSTMLDIPNYQDVYLKNFINDEVVQKSIDDQFTEFFQQLKAEQEQNL